VGRRAAGGGGGRRAGGRQEIRGTALTALLSLPSHGGSSQFSERLASFRSATQRGEAEAKAGAATVHANTITQLRLLPSSSAAALFAFSTSAADGRLALWAADEGIAAQLARTTLA